jgi:hypothetical protein
MTIQLSFVLTGQLHGPAETINNLSDQQTITGVVIVSATATDDIAIQKVEFYLDGALVGTDTTFPYQFEWNTFAASNTPHILAAKAYDTGGHTSTTQITVTVSCITSFSPANLFFSANGGSGSVNIVSAGPCNWPVSTNDNWIVITSPRNGSGTDKVNIEVRENFTGSARQGSLTIGGRIISVFQNGRPSSDCSYTISPKFQSFPASGGAGMIQVSASELCAWQAVAKPSWVTITSGNAGIGNGTVTYLVDANTSTSIRKGIITIAGKTYSVKQKGN